MLSYEDFFGEEKFRQLPSENTVADEKNLVQSAKFYHPQHESIGYLVQYS